MGFLSTNVEKRREMILNGNILNTLLFLSFPTLLMGMVQSLIPLSDGLFLNRTSGYLVAAAVGFGQPIINIINALSQGLGVASMAIVGQINGTGDLEEVKKVSTQIMVFSFIIGLVVAPTSIIFASVVSKSISPEIAYDVFLYLSLYAIVIPMLFMAAIFNAIKNATGQPEATLIRMIILLLLKIIFNSIFLAVLHWGVIGAVMASLCSYIVIAIWMYYDLFIKESMTKLDLRGFSFDFKLLKRLLKLALPTMLTYSLINFGFFLINMEVERYGAYVLTAQTIASNINAMCFNLPSSIGTTVTTMVSMNIGARKPRNAKKSFIYGCRVSVIISLIIIVLFLPSSNYLVRLFQDNETIVNLADHSLKIYTFSIIGFGIYMVSQGAFIGLGRTRLPLFMGILRVWFIRYIFILITKRWLGVDSVFWGNLVSNYIAGFLFYYIVTKTPWKSVLKR
ncbi:MAG: MATE family efflux transporter [Fusobacterium mortiferum]|jgi:putative MATE family efflux protein|uniref:Multidrug-efflux transporter n=1 Tax=Fusobacterium mortiferum TaxID=850 RepID=A0A414Q262_FUSMR|nr:MULTISPECIES: MATE family efflux transporter [Fusobacterium]MCF2626733.1 MATE family efflux transporter [Fusobacterium mortiferum]MCI7188751.1 MATE family efflux transporter [Fusobacterium mortiferum]MDY4802167.1 MATE family efflux transporter [Fusobacterium mortiferum]MSS60400.1 MATE family efflux transporter [Fusobacterium sp. FSA-380-WT-2B]RHF74885.1 MATE family efflux transporter [Fusobacterium mortiferum]